MRKLCVLIVCLGLSSLAQHCYGWVPYSEGKPMAPAGGMGQVEGDMVDFEDCDCGREGCPIGRRLRGRMRRVAQTGYDNCSCRGSYKFPVPPQYTYHWPGMYSMQRMTEYNSPWRFPPLESARSDAVPAYQAFRSGQQGSSAPRGLPAPPRPPRM